MACLANNTLPYPTTQNFIDTIFSERLHIYQITFDFMTLHEKELNGNLIRNITTQILFFMYFSYFFVHVLDSLLAWKLNSRIIGFKVFLEDLKGVAGMDQ